MTRPPLIRTLAAAALAGAASIALAQTPAPKAPAAPLGVDAERFAREAERFASDAAKAAQDAVAYRWDLLASAGDFEFDFDVDTDAPSYAFISREFGSTREIVKNAPYQAEAVNEVVQTLFDGNRIVRRSSAIVARDGVGRTRQERKGGTVFVFDPIDNRSYALNPERKTAVRIPRAPSLITPPAMAPIPPIPPIPPAPSVSGATPSPAIAPRVSERVIVRRGVDGREVEVAPGRVVVRRGGEGKDVEDVRIEVIRVGRSGQASHDAMSIPPLALPLLPRGKGDTKALGTREFDGVKADGSMTSHTIPAGEIGNEKPIVITSERWFSPELHVVVYAKTSDPRNGDTIYRLANLKRGEPPADWFRVPSDYKVRRP
ncbi:MAG: hypothetical protein ABI585_14950 [Betaproteobacteria bacterium]